MTDEIGDSLVTKTDGTTNQNDKTHSQDVFEAQSIGVQHKPKIIIFIGFLLVVVFGTVAFIFQYSLPTEKPQAEEQVAIDNVNNTISEKKVEYGTRLPNKLNYESGLGSWSSFETQDGQYVSAVNTEVVLSDQATSGIRLRTTGENSRSYIVMPGIRFPEDARVLDFCYQFTEPGDQSWITVFFTPYDYNSEAEIIWKMGPVGDGSPMETVNGDAFLLDSFIFIDSLAGLEGDLTIALNNMGSEPANVNLSDFRILLEEDLVTKRESDQLKCIVNKASQFAEKPENSGEFEQKLTEMATLQKDFKVSFNQMRTIQLATISSVLQSGESLLRTTDGDTILRSDTAPTIYYENFAVNGSMVSYAGRENGALAITERQFLGNREIENHKTEVVFSEDGQHYAFIASELAENGEEQLQLHINDGMTLLPPYRLIKDIGFYSGTSKVYFVATMNGKDRLVVDGVEGARYDNIKDLKFSTDGKTLIYKVRDGEYEFIVEGASEGQKFWRVDEPNFISDAGDYIYRGVNVENDTQVSTVVKNTTVGPKYRRFGGYAASGDGRVVVYAAGINEEDFVCVEMLPDGSIKEYGEISETNNCYVSPDGESMAYVSTSKVPFNYSKYLVINGEKLNSYDRVTDLVFSPDSNQYAYVAREFIKTEDNGERNETIYDFVVSDGVESDRFEHVNTPLFSANGSIAYRAKENGKWLVVRDEQKTDAYTNTSVISFVGDTETLMYQVTEDEDVYLVFDDGAGDSKRIGPYHEIYYEDIIFNEDYSQVAFGARKGRELWWIVETIR